MFNGSGNRDLLLSLERLERVARTQIPVEAAVAKGVALAPKSSLPTTLGAIATAVALPKSLALPAVVAAGGAYATALFMASPRAVDWLTRSIYLEQRGASAAQIAAHAERLREIIDHDSDLRQALQKPSVREE
jgi:hypothetical protein